MPTFYKIADKQVHGRYFADGELFRDEEEVREQLISYHEVDWSGEYEIETLTLTDVLEYGDWEIESIEGIDCPLCGEAIEPREIKQNTWIWTCPKCAFVGFEYNNNEQLENINNYLKKQL